jgi:16S rRNA (adenine1518-N6/adenine1519-N6)-dimethyltransferase
MPTLHQEALAAFHELNFTPNRGRGQNFLVHERVIESILRAVDVQPADEIVEVGPGIGFVTRRLLATCRTVWGIEVDDRLVEWLRSSALGSHPAFRLIHEDVLQTDFSRILPPRPVKVVANLPYNIATAVLAHFFTHAHHFSELTVMVQREVAQRLAAVPGSKAYGPLAILLAIHGQITQKFSVSAEAFLPRPKVQSTVLHIRVNDAPSVPSDDIPFLKRVVRTAFGQRRKILSNSLSPLLAGGREEATRILYGLGIDAHRRAETLSLEEFVQLSRSLGRERERQGDKETR